VRRLSPLVEGVAAGGRPVLWISDPMHGNGIQTDGASRPASFDDILAELEQTLDIHAPPAPTSAGVHFELTGEDVTECVGGAGGRRRGRPARTTPARATRG
jgi:3-deoxy-7-phosphoheptulonate synthase